MLSCEKFAVIRNSYVWPIIWMDCIIMRILHQTLCLAVLYWRIVICVHQKVVFSSSYVPNQAE